MAFDILTLYNAKIEFIYNLRLGIYSRRVVDELWTEFGILPDARSLGETYIGSSVLPSGGLLITIWNVNITSPSGDVIPYIGTWTYEGCISVSRTTLSEKYGNEILSFYNATTIVSDPNAQTTLNNHVTDLVITNFDNKLFISVTQFGKIGSLVLVRRDVNLNEDSSPVYSIKSLLGKDQAENHILARHLATWVRYDRRRQQVKTYSRDEIKEKGLDFTEPTTLEEEYEHMVKHQNLDGWEQKRIQRPWNEEPDRP